MCKDVFVRGVGKLQKQFAFKIGQFTTDIDWTRVFRIKYFIDKFAFQANATSRLVFVLSTTEAFGTK